MAINKEFRTLLPYINRFLSITAASVNIKKITIKEEGGDFTDLYPPMSIFFQAMRSSIKTTMFRSISKITGIKPFKKISAASMEGSINTSNNQGVPPSAWKARNNVMMLDEFNSSGKEGETVKQVLLDIVEFGEYRKSLGMAVKKSVKEEDGDLYLSINKNEIEFKTRTAVIIATMVEHQVDVYHDALMSRCLPIRYFLDDPEEIYKNNIRFKISEIKVKENVTIKLKDWKKIYRLSMNRYPQDPALQLRITGLLAKIYAVLGYHDMVLYEIVIYLKTHEGIITADMIKTIEAKYDDKKNKDKGSKGRKSA